MTREELLEHLIGELEEYAEGLSFRTSEKQKLKYTEYRALGIIDMLLGFDILNVEE